MSVILEQQNGKEHQNTFTLTDVRLFVKTSWENVRIYGEQNTVSLQCNMWQIYVLWKEKMLKYITEREVLCCLFFIDVMMRNM